TLSATTAASTRSSMATAVRVLSPARLSRPSTASANTASATSISISEKPAARGSAGGAIDLHLAATAHRHVRLSPFAQQHQALRRGRAGGVEAERNPGIAPRKPRLRARRPVHAGKGATVERLPAIEAPARECVA